MVNNNMMGDEFLQLLVKKIEEQKFCDFNNCCLTQALGWRHSARAYDCSKSDSQTCGEFYKLKQIQDVVVC